MDGPGETTARWPCLLGAEWHDVDMSLSPMAHSGAAVVRDGQAASVGVGPARWAMLSTVASGALPATTVSAVSIKAEAELPLVEAAPVWRLSRRVFGGLVGVGDAAVLAVATLVVWKLARVPVVPAVAGVAGFLTLAWVGGQYAPRGEVARPFATLAA